MSVYLRQWWTRKYKLPPNHDLFVNRSLGSLTQEMLEDFFDRRKEMAESLRTGHGDKSTLRESLASLERVLGERPDDCNSVVTGDPLVDEWEKELDAGRIPDSLREWLYTDEAQRRK